MKIMGHGDGFIIVLLFIYGLVLAFCVRNIHYLFALRHRQKLHSGPMVMFYSSAFLTIFSRIIYFAGMIGKSQPYSIEVWLILRILPSIFYLFVGVSQVLLVSSLLITYKVVFEKRTEEVERNQATVSKQRINYLVGRLQWSLTIFLSLYITGTIIYYF